MYNYEIETLEKTVCFTGHRPKNLPWQDDLFDKRCLNFKFKLSIILETLISAGYNKFITGMALGTDLICASVVIALKSKYKNIILECAIPQKNVHPLWTEAHKKFYQEILDKSDIQTLINDENIYDYTIYKKRNEYMVNNSSIVVGVFSGISGGTKQTLLYAKKKNKNIIIINPIDLNINTVLL